MQTSVDRLGQRAIICVGNYAAGGIGRIEIAGSASSCDVVVLSPGGGIAVDGRFCMCQES
jgi:hypothetical protein